MKRSIGRRLSLVSVAAAAGLGTATALAQDGRTEEVRRAAEELERAEERLETAREVVEQREEELQIAIAEAAESAPSNEPAGNPEWYRSEWEGLIDGHPNLRTFVEALRLTGLDATLTNGTEYTVFAPTDDAFDEHDRDLLDEDNRERLIDALRAHIVADDLDEERLRSLDQALTVDGGRLDVAIDDDEIMVDDAIVMVGNAHTIETDGGDDSLRIYPIDRVLGD